MRAKTRGRERVTSGGFRYGSLECSKRHDLRVLQRHMLLGKRVEVRADAGEDVLSAFSCFQGRPFSRTIRSLTVY